MTDMLANAILAAPSGREGGGGWEMIIGLVLMLAVFYGIMLSSSRKDKRKRQQMLSAVKKNDRVMTIGGIVGSVVSVSDSEVTIKVDESANVKITLVRGAIQRVLRDDERPGDIQ